MTKSKTRRNSNYQRFEKLIIDAFLSLFKEKRKSNITIADIIEKAKVSRPTFYLHFKTIDDIYQKVEDQLIERIICLFYVKYEDFLEGLLDIQNRISKEIASNIEYYRTVAYSNRLSIFINAAATRVANTYLEHGKRNGYVSDKSYAHNQLSIYLLITITLSAWAAKLRGDLEIDASQIPEYITNLTYLQHKDWWEKQNPKKEIKFFKNKK